MYINPGKAFIEQYGLVEGPEAVEKYAGFLREFAGLTDDPPIDLAAIFAGFSIPAPTRTTLSGWQGLVLDSDKGVILIEENDHPARQRFTEAHELMELFFEALPKQSNAHGHKVSVYKHHTKERLCNLGAAELLMPKSTFLPRVELYGVSSSSARQLAQEYGTSFSSALIRIASIGPGAHAVVLWRMKNKPVEVKRRTPETQMPLIEDVSVVAVPRLRVEWAYSSPSAPFIPENKSVPNDSLIQVAWQSHCPTTGSEFLDLSIVKGIIHSENQPFEANGEWQVLSLLHLPGDENCNPES